MPWGRVAMAITACHFDFYSYLLGHGLLRPGGNILELGQAEWYGDKNPFDLLPAIEEIEDERRKAELTSRFHKIFTMDGGRGQYRYALGSFHMAELFYRIYLDPKSIAAIDLDGTARSTVHNLNYPVEAACDFDLVINNDTAEHIFNIAEVFRTMHSACKTGGVMIHDSPFTGGIDHFYAIQPTLYYDLRG